MPEFRRYLCWQPANANGAINTEAVVPSQAVFTATHSPLRIRRAHIRGRSLELMEGKADENAVLADFMERDSDTGTLLMPVVGDSGTGKSHLVRWVGMNIPPADRYRVIYLEKSRTSLKAVIETLLADTDSNSLAKLKADIGSFSSGLDATALARRIINALNESLAQTTPQDMDGQARALAGTRGLASILQDPYIQEYMLDEGKFIPQLASQLLRDQKDPGAGERPPGFTVHDLPLQVTDENQAAQISRTLLRYLLANPGLRAAAVDLLNHHLETAVRNAYQLGAGRLYTAMLQVREEYARQGKEIILLIEDFALIQGVQRELLDAITEPAIRNNKTKYARIRTLMAVTTGYFTDLPETAMSRVAAATTGYVYDLDVPFSRRDNGIEEIASFAGRYLNAARVGREELDRRGAGNAPNKCDTCDFKTECHEAFGATTEGYGLYPFNRSALIRTVHSVNSRARAATAQEWVFVPRTVLGSVIRPILIEDYETLGEGSFPDDRFRERFPGAPIDRALPNTVAQAIIEFDRTTPEQRTLILEFWGNAPDDASMVRGGVLKAFGLEPLSQEASSRPPTDRQADVTIIDPGNGTENPAEPRISASLLRKVQNIEEWGARPQAELGVDVSRDLRVLLADAVTRRYTFRSPLMRELAKSVMEKAWPRNSTVVSITGAGGQRLTGAESAPIRFERTPLNSLFFQSLLRARTDVNSARAEDTRRLASIAETNAAPLTAALQRYLGITDVELTTALRASLLGAALAGQAWPACTEADLLCAAFDDGNTWQRGDRSLLSPPWQQALDSHLRSRSDMVQRLRNSVGVAQGTGAVRMLDAARVLPLLREATNGWTWSAQTQVPDWVKPAVTGFARWEAMVEDQFSRLTTNLSNIRQLLPAQVSGSETAEAVGRALQESAKVGLAPSQDDALRLQALLDRVQHVNWRVITETGDDLTKARSESGAADSWTTKVTAVARDRGESFGAIGEFLEASGRLLDDALERAAVRRDPVGDDAAGQVSGLLNEWGGLLDAEVQDK